MERAFERLEALNKKAARSLLKPEKDSYALQFPLHLERLKPRL
jgi:hypothetical protein